MLFLSGCAEKKDNNEDETKEENNIQDFENMILGTWFRNETIENYTYFIEYKFFSNQSFFSGVKEKDVDSYNVSIWGNYIIDDEFIKFIIDGDTNSSSTLKYLISPEGDFLLLYYDDGINYDLLKKVV